MSLGLLVFSGLAACAEPRGEDVAIQLRPAGACEITSWAEACTDCVRFDHHVDLGSDEEVGFLVEDGTVDDVVRDRHGRYWVGQETHVNVYDSLGRFVRAVGQLGEGPLEFQYAQPTFVSSDGRVQIVDPLNMRITSVAPDFTVAEERPLPAPTQQAVGVFDGRRSVVQAWIPDADRIGLPLHLVEGRTIISSFGLRPGAEERREVSTPASARRVLATGADDQVLSAEFFAYEIDVWSTEGAFLGSVSGLPLNPEGLQPGPYTLENPPRNQIYDINVDESGRLWVALLMRREDWRSGVTEQIGPGGVVSLNPTDGDIASIYESRLDVIDPAACELVATTRRAGILLRFIDGETITQLVHAGGFYPRLRVWKVRYDEQ